MGLRQGFVSPKDRETISPEIGVADAIGAAFGLGQSGSIIGSYSKIHESSQLDTEYEKEGGQLLTPEHVKQNYTFDPEAYPTEDISKSKADWMQEEYNKSQQREFMVAGAADKFGGTVLPFIARMAGYMADPVDMAINVGLGFGVGAVVKGLATSAKLASALPKMQAAAQAARGGHRGAKYGLAVAEAGASVALSTKLEQIGMREVGIEMSNTEMMQSILFSSVAFTGLVHGGGALLGKLGKLGNPAVENVAKYYSDMKTNGYKPDMDSITKAVEQNLVDDSITGLVRNTFAEDVGEDLLKGVEMKRDLGQKLADAVDSGKITEADFNKFMAGLDEQNIAREHFDPELNNLYIDPETREAMKKNVKRDIDELTPEDIEASTIKPEDISARKEVDAVDPVFEATISEPEFKKFEKAVLAEADSLGVREYAELTEGAKVRDLAEAMNVCLRGA